MNPDYVFAGSTHTISEKLVEYLIEPFSSISVILIIIVMFSNTYILRKLWKIKEKDYVTLLNIITLGIYVSMSIISAVLVSRLGPHGTLNIDDCDTKYMFLPKILFNIVAVINIIVFIIGMFTKIQKNIEYNKTVKRGYYAEAKEKDINNEKKTKPNPKNEKSMLDSIALFIKKQAEKIDEQKIKEKVNQFANILRNLINRIGNKE